jgi:hypothetical protein
VPIEEEGLRRRFEWKRDQDLAEITNRIEQVSVERAYRIVGALEKRAQELEDHYVPMLRELIGRWRRLVLRWDFGMLLLAGLAAAVVLLLSPTVVGSLKAGFDQLLARPTWAVAAAAVLAGVVLYLHFTARRWAKQRVLREVAQENSDEEAERLSRAFKRNTRVWRSIFAPDPVGWSGRNRKALRRIVASANRLVQTLNDRFTDPSGKRPASEEKKKKEKEELPVISGEVLPRGESV